MQARLPVDLHQQLVEGAKESERSLNGQILYVLRRAISDLKAELAAQDGVDELTTQAPKKPKPMTDSQRAQIDALMEMIS